MAKNVGVIGAMKGKVGNMVFRTRRGEQIASVYQPVVHNPKSARQEMSRAKMTMATDAAKSLKLLLRAGWQKTNPTYEVQQFVKRAIPLDNRVITGLTPDSLEFDWAVAGKCVSANLLGYLTGMQQPDFSEEGEVSISFTPADELFLDGEGGAIGCGLVVGLYVPAFQQCIVKHFPCTKGQTLERAILYPSEWSGMKAVVFAFAKQIPNALNGIPSENAPWKYPADTTMAYSMYGNLA